MCGESKVRYDKCRIPGDLLQSYTVGSNDLDQRPLRRRFDLIRFPFCTAGPCPRIFFLGFGGCAKSEGSSPRRYLPIHQRTYLRSLVSNPASLSRRRSSFQRSSHDSAVTFVSADLPIAFKKSCGDAREPLIGGTGRRAALLTSVRQTRGTRAMGLSPSQLDILVSERRNQKRTRETRENTSKLAQFPLPRIITW